MLEFPPCPVCGGELPLKEFFGEWDPASRISRDMAPSPALECPSCFARLRPKFLRAGIMTTAALISSIALMFVVIRSFAGNGLAGLAAVVAFLASVFWIEYSLLRRLITWRPAAPDEHVTFILPTRAQRDASEEGMRADAEAVRAEAARDLANYPPWSCLTCGEENPGRFDLCWKCESNRLRSSVPDEYGRLV